MIDGYPTAVYALDGKHFIRRKTKTLPPGVSRKSFYGHKHKMPEVENNQAKVDTYGICCEFLSGNLFYKYK